jgi:hypothetical protein
MNPPDCTIFAQLSSIAYFLSALQSAADTICVLYIRESTAYDRRKTPKMAQATYDQKWQERRPIGR